MTDPLTERSHPEVVAERMTGGNEGVTTSGSRWMFQEEEPPTAARHTPDGAKRRRSVPLEGSRARHPAMGLAERGTARLRAGGGVTVAGARSSTFQ